MAHPTRSQSTGFVQYFRLRVYKLRAVNCLRLQVEQRRHRANRAPGGPVAERDFRHDSDRQAAAKVIG